MRNALTTILVALMALSIWAVPVPAVEPDEILSNPVLESRARELSTQIRCLVCQNQSIDDSNAPLAKDLRILVREKLTKGLSDRQILDYLVARYGEFVLLKPVFALHTLLLWAVPLLALITGFVVAVVLFRRSFSQRSDPKALSKREHQQLAKILDKGD